MQLPAFVGLDVQAGLTDQPLPGSQAGIAHMGWIAQQFDRLQVASRTACPHDPEDGLNKPTILGHNTPVTGLAWQALLTFPLVGTQHLRSILTSPKSQDMA